MRARKAGNVLTGLGVFALIIILYPSLKPVVDSFMTTILGLAPGADAFSTFILNTTSYWGLIIAFVVAFLIVRRD